MTKHSANSRKELLALKASLTRQERLALAALWFEQAKQLMADAEAMNPKPLNPEN